MSDLDHEVRIRRKSGEIRWHRMMSRPGKTGGNAVLFDGIDMDITDRKEAEARLAEYSENLEEMVEARTKELENFYNVVSPMIANNGWHQEDS